jgi:hypothetical protein
MAVKVALNYVQNIFYFCFNYKLLFQVVVFLFSEPGQGEWVRDCY